MKCVRPGLLSSLILAFMCSINPQLYAQAQPKSARALAQADGYFIARNIEDNQMDISLCQKAVERSANPRLTELAQQMLEDHIAMLYSLQQLSAAGSGGSSGANAEVRAVSDSAVMAFVNVDVALSKTSGADFDMIWVDRELAMHQAKLDELTQAVTTAYNPQLKMAITEAIPKIRKYRDQLNSLKKALAKTAVKAKKVVPVK